MEIARDKASKLGKLFVIKNEKRPSTIAWSTILRIIGYATAPVWVAPAVYYNLDWLKGSLGDNLAAVTFICAAALCFLALHWLSNGWLKVMAVVLGMGLTCNNSWNALENISNVDNRRIDDRKQEIEDSDRRSSARSGWSAAVTAAKLLVQDKSVTELEGDVERYEAENAAAWNSSRQCKGKLTTSAAFCAEHARLKGLIETARTRDSNQALITAQDEANKGKGKPTHADNMAATVILMMAPLHRYIDPSPESIRAWRIATKTFWLEAQAAIMPAIHIALIDTLIAFIKATMRLASAVRARVARRPEPAADGAPAPVQKAPKSKITPEFTRFCADEYELGPTYTIDPTPAYELFCKWRTSRGLPKVSQRKFGDMMTEAGPEAGWRRDPNNGYPRYIGVRAKVRDAKFRVVS